MAKVIKLIKIIESLLCASCESRENIVNIEFGKQTPRMYCHRLDCDNWDFPMRNITLNIGKEHTSEF